MCVWAFGYWTFNNDYGRRAQGYVVAFWVVFIIIFLVEIGMNKTIAFIRNVKRAEDAKNVLDKLREKDPHINMRLENYHYEFVHRRNTIDYQKRTSSTHTKEVRYSEYTDRSADPSSVSHMKKAKLTRLDLLLDIQYTPQAS